MELKKDILIGYFALFLMSILPIYYASWRSLKSVKTESISSKDAVMYPVIMSIVLFGFYLFVKFFREDLLNTVVSGYFVLVSLYSVNVTFRPLFDVISPSFITSLPSMKFDLSSIPQFIHKFSFGLLLKKKEEQTWKFEVHALDVVGYCAGLILNGLFLWNENWIVIDTLGLCFCISFIEMCELGSFKNGFYLLAGLFLYDVFWVYGTDVMVTVAKSIKAPVKLLWPRDDDFAMLGLGDIVIPGIFVALMIRFDQYLADQKKVKGTGNGVNEAIYFKVSYIFYIISFIVGLVVLTVFQHAQPMMFYFVPALLISVIVMSIIRRELKELVFYGVEEKDEKEEEGEEEVYFSSDDEEEGEEEEEEEQGKREGKKDI